MRYRILPKADRDLDQIASHFAEEADVDLALRFLNAAHQTFSLLATQPTMGRKCELRNAILRDVRMFRVREFPKILMLYRVLGKYLEIVRVVHGARDLEAVFETD